jgi:hypothetical protein
MPVMSRLVVLGLAGAALVFVGVSAIMNAVFLASLGRTGPEAALLAAVSLAADLAKAVLPIVILQAWLAANRSRLLASLSLLVVVVGLSITSGMGFAASVRDGAAAARQAHHDSQARLRRDLQDIDQRLAPIAAVRDARIVRREIATLEAGWLFAAASNCTAPKSAAARRHCNSLDQLRVTMAEADTRDDLMEKREVARQQLAALDAAGSSRDSDAQLTALATMIGWSRDTIKVAMALWIAVTLEIGGFVLVGLAAAVATERRQGGSSPETAPEILTTSVGEVVMQPAASTTASQLPAIADRLYWQKQRRVRAVGRQPTLGGTP